jgi:hypothetical protein
MIDISRTQLEELKAYIKRIYERRDMFITSSETIMLVEYAKRYLNKKISTGCSTCLRQTLMELKDFTDAGLLAIEKVLVNDDVEIIGDVEAPELPVSRMKKYQRKTKPQSK